jgi:hypothetical protein
VFGQVGSTAIEDGSDSLQYSLIGSAGVSREIGRTWSLQGGFDRSVRFVPAFLDPLLTSAFTARLGGRLTNRSMLNLSASRSVGAVGFRGPDSGNDLASYTGNALFRHEIGRRIGLYAEYFYFSSAFGSAVMVSDAVSSKFRRNGIRVGVSVGTTLLGDRR